MLYNNKVKEDFKKLCKLFFKVLFKSLTTISLQFNSSFFSIQNMKEEFLRIYKEDLYYINRNNLTLQDLIIYKFIKHFCCEDIENTTSDFIGENLFINKQSVIISITKLVKLNLVNKNKKIIECNVNTDNKVCVSTRTYYFVKNQEEE